MSTTGPSTLRERIAALQQRGTSPQPTSSPPRSQTPNGPPNAGGTALRDKIAKFELKGGTPIPRGSFGLGAPPPSTGKKNNELWGNRIPSTTSRRPLAVGTPSVDRIASMSAGSPGRTRRVSMADVQMSSVENLQVKTALEDVPKGSDMIQSLDIATHSPSSPSFVSKSPASPERRLYPLEETNHETPSRHEPAVVVVAAPPVSSTPPIIITQEEADGTLVPALPPDNSSPQVELSIGVDVSAVPEAVLGDDSPTPTSSVITLGSLSNPIRLDADDSLAPVEDVGKLSSLSIHFPSHPESPPMELAVPTDQSSVSRLPLIVAEVPQISLDGASTSTDSSLSRSLQEESTPVVHETLPPAEDSVDTEAEVISATDDNSSPIGATIQPCSPAPADESPLLAVADIHRVPQSEESVTLDVETLSEGKDPGDHLEDPKSKLSAEQSSYLKQSRAVPTSSNAAQDPDMISEISPKIQNLQNLAAGNSAPQDRSIASTHDTRPSTASSEVSSDSPPRVTPLLDAFPAVPKFLPSSSLPARARTISGRPRAADRMSASSTSSTKSTPSLSFSSASSTTSSPTSAATPTPSQPPDFRRPASGLQRSKSQTTRPISSVPSWYDDDSDDGEAGWANVIVTTRRY